MNPKLPSLILYFILFLPLSLLLTLSFSCIPFFLQELQAEAKSLSSANHELQSHCSVLEGVSMKVLTEQQKRSEYEAEARRTQTENQVRVSNSAQFVRFFDCLGQVNLHCVYISNYPTRVCVCVCANVCLCHPVPLLSVALKGSQQEMF